MYFEKYGYPPYDSKELKEYDPEGYAMIQKLRNIDDSTLHARDGR